MFSKLLPFFPVGYVPHTRWRFAVSYEMKTNGTWIDSASDFASVEGVQGFTAGYIFVFVRTNEKLQRSNSCIYCLDVAKFIERVCSLGGMNEDESKVKVGIDYGKSFLIVSPKMTVDYCNEFHLHESSPSGSAFKFFVAKRMLLQAPEIHLNRQEIVY